ncbi:MAG: DUF423 domain-containing protein [Flavobacteriales bacterium]
MDRRTLALASGILLVAVGLGAFGAHGLKTRVTPEALAQWRTGVEYQFYHGLGLMLLAAFGSSLSDRTRRTVCWLFLAGIVCFCGSLYLLSTREVLGTMTLTPVLGPITPLGGLLFMAGWAVLLLRALRGADGR